MLEYYKWDKRDKTVIKSLEQEITGIKEKINLLVDVEIASEDSFPAWWNENEDYMYLSEDGTKLLLNSDAKQAENPVHETMPEREVSAEDYWWLSTEPTYRQTKVTETHVHGEIAREQWPDKIRVEKIKLGNLALKERVYKSKLEDEIMYFKNAPEARQFDYLEYATGRLKNLTGMQFTDTQSWIKWWEKNRDRLVLSKDGTVLVVGD